MEAKSLQTVIGTTLNKIEERFSRVEHAIERLETRITDLEILLYEITGDDDRTEVSFASTASTHKYTRPPTTKK